MLAGYVAATALRRARCAVLARSSSIVERSGRFFTFGQPYTPASRFVFLARYNSSSSGNDGGDGNGSKGRRVLKHSIGKEEAKRKQRGLKDDPSSISTANNGNADTSANKQQSYEENGDGADVVDDVGGRSKSDALQTIQVPLTYSPILAIPITRRPLFPGFYKTIVIKDVNVINAIKDISKNQQPYVATVLLKDDDVDTDKVKNFDDIYRVGVFAQITNIYHSVATNENESQSLTAILYPHHRIRIHSLVTSMGVSKVTTTPMISTVSTNDETPLIVEVDKQPVLSTEITAKESSLPSSALVKSSRDTSPQSYLSSKFDVSLVTTQLLADEPYKKGNQLIRAITSEIINVFKDIATLNPLFREQIAAFSVSQSSSTIFDDPSRLADFAAAVSGGSDSAELQSVLESLVIEERLQKALYVLKKELVNAQLQNKISKDVESKIAKRQREYYLMEQLKGIKKELGIESDGKDKLIEKFRDRQMKLNMPKAVAAVFDEEINKLQHLEPASSEFNVTRNYLDWITTIPWGQHSSETLDIMHARKVLDEDHYGLKDVKDRILEFIAVGRLRGTVEGKIICLVGPPGVGKTSIGKSIARALSREYFRFSVGGLADVAEIKGHRRTYVGAMPGKIIQALKKVQTENPLILIDEVDKLGRGHQGDPASALLELLDPEQNSAFLDHYMDVPVDLSKVLFVCTANVLDTIPAPLLDRMEVITLSGYVSDEKIAIASRYLAPQARQSCGIDPAHCGVNVTLSDEALEHLIKYYCRESGVRNLKKHIDKIYRKAAFKVVQEYPDMIIPSAETAAAVTEAVNASDKSNKDDKDDSIPPSNRPRMEEYLPGSPVITVESQNLKDYVGNPPFTTERLFETTPVGVVMGLAWTAMGGSSLYIESVLETTLTKDGKPSLSKTGQLGDVMKESSTIAYTYAKSLLARKIPESKFFNHASVHLHVPEGATPKDGPSAGITMTTSLLSLALNTPVSAYIAMTGELTLSGRVLRIGGLKEKVIAAKRSSITKILFPASNKADWDELPDYIKQGIEGIPVEWYDEVYDAIFGDETSSQRVRESALAWVISDRETGREKTV